MDDRDRVMKIDEESHCTPGAILGHAITGTAIVGHIRKTDAWHTAAPAPGSTPAADCEAC